MLQQRDSNLRLDMDPSTYSTSLYTLLCMRVNTVFPHLHSCAAHMAILGGGHGIVGTLGRQGHISQPHTVPCGARYTQGLVGRPLQAAVHFSLFCNLLL